MSRNLISIPGTEDLGFKSHPQDSYSTQSVHVWLYIYSIVQLLSSNLIKQKLQQDYEKFAGFTHLEPSKNLHVYTCTIFLSNISDEGADITK